MYKKKEDWSAYMKNYRKNHMTQEEKALALLRLFIKKIKNGQFDVETASWWQGMGKSATLRIDVISDNYEEYDDIPRN